MNTTVKPGGTREFNSLALLALKVAPNTFDLSSGLYHVSIRDQIVRGQLLIRDLCKVHQGSWNILIVGTGIAGITAGMAAAEMGKKVCFVDRASKPFALQAKVRGRFVGPFMYEWPHGFFDDQSYPPDVADFWPRVRSVTPEWQADRPIKASRLAEELSTWLTDTLKRPPPYFQPPDFWFQVDPAAVRGFVHRFVERTSRNLWLRMQRYFSTSSEELQAGGRRWDWANDRYVADICIFKPDYVVLAAGMGSEKTQIPSPDPSRPSAPFVAGPEFWCDDSLRSREARDEVIGVFGGGDGALQDVLRAMTRFRHPLHMLAFLRDEPESKAALDHALEDLRTLEQKYRHIDTWGSDALALEKFDASCRDLARALAKNTPINDRVFEAARKGRGKVCHYMRESHFTRGYLLNRFLVHLIRECRSARGSRWVGRMDYESYPGSEFLKAHEVTRASGPRYCVHIQVGKLAPKDYYFDQIAVRFGAHRDSAPGSQMVRLSDQDDGQRTSLAHIPLPLVVPHE